MIYDLSTVRFNFTHTKTKTTKVKRLYLSSLLCVSVVYLVTQRGNESFQVVLLVNHHLFLLVLLLQLHLQLPQLHTKK